MQTTTNLGLKKPESTDTVNIADLNYNADKLDTEVKKAQQISDKAKGMIVVQAQETSTLGHWVATVPEITELEYGLQLCICAPEYYEGRPVLNINSLGNIPITSQIYGGIIAAKDFVVSTGDYLVVTFCSIFDEDEEGDYIDAWVTSASTGYIISVISAGTSSASGYVTQKIISQTSFSRYYVNTAKYYTSTGQNTDGAMTQKAITDALATVTPKTATITVPASGGTVSVTGMTATAVVWVAPNPSSADVYATAGCRCTAQADGSLTFTVDETATEAMSVNVAWM